MAYIIIKAKDQAVPRKTGGLSREQASEFITSINPKSSDLNSQFKEVYEARHYGKLSEQRSR